MPDLVPAPLSTLLKRAHHERARQRSIFDLPLSEMYRGSSGVDLGVRFHDLHAGTPLGPAAGPHDQLAQNVVLAWLGGSRVIELKTVQARDQLVIGRPCIDATNVCFNIEWSQELALRQSLREYVKASMIIDILREENALGVADPAALPAGFFDTVYDLSVGYDLAGITGDAMTAFVRQAMRADGVVDELRREIPDEYARYRDHPFRTDLVRTATLSTFHGCPKDEIEGICRHLLDVGLHTIVKLNPVQLGREKLEHVLHERLGYTHLRVSPGAYQTGLSLEEARELVERLEPVARRRGLNVGVKFSNTLEVVNELGRLPDEVMYLSGQPLHVIAVALVDEWRAMVGDRFPVSFAAGIDRRNFANAVAMGLVPVTVCTDLLRPRGYGRQAGYLKELEAAMRAAGAATVDEYVLRARGGAAAPDRERAVLRNTRAIAAETLEDPRYAWDKNRREPNKVHSHLYAFDCLSCDKCLPVCPNDANFSFLVEPERFPYRDYRLSRGDLLPDESRWHAIERERQFATYADFCNECGNCDTFCPEHGGPFWEKPLLFGSRESWAGRPGRDGCYVEREGGVDRVVGRAGGRTYRLEVARGRDEAVFDDGTVELRLRLSSRELLGWRALDPALAVPDPARPPHRHAPDHVVSMGVMYRMEALLRGVLDERRVNYVNAPFLAGGAEAVETVEAAVLVR